MRNVLLSACAVIALTLGAAAASADDNDYYGYDNGGGYNDNGQYQDQDYDSNGNDGYGYSQDIVSPGSIVQDLSHQGFRNISRPALAGKFYQVKAVNPNGKKVKLYIDAYTGQIVKVKS